MSPRHICVVTGSRAEYGLMSLLLKRLQEDPDIRLSIVATGMHLSSEFGLTASEIEADGLPITERVEMLQEGDSASAVTKAIGIGTIGFAETFERLRPDLCLVLGDRFEILAAAQAAMVARIPIAHIHGGETSEGAIDESIRHAVTKMSQLHFVAAAPYRQRVIQLGEHPDRVFHVGSLGVDVIYALDLMNAEAIEQDLGLDMERPIFVVTYHPATLGDTPPEVAVAKLFAALDEFPDAQCVITKSNADAGGKRINNEIDRYATGKGDRVYVSTSLGQLRYLSLLKHATAVIGNSSSGIIEAPVFEVPTVNIGDRQRGRLRAGSVIDCIEDRHAIRAAIDRAISRDFRLSLRGLETPYGKPGAPDAIAEILRSTDLKTLGMKSFYDLRQ